jgi:DNA polymerase
VTGLSTANEGTRVAGKRVRRRSANDQAAQGQISKLIARASQQSPTTSQLEILKHAAAKCHACDLWKHATQTVFGNGSSSSRVVFVGEQPGDREDLEGEPFVGPAGKLLREAMLGAGINPKRVYLTNVVKHFRWVTSGRGKRRIHKKPRQSEIEACRPWLDSEMNAIAPQVLVCLGSTAAKALLGKDFSVRRQRGNFVQSSGGPAVMATIHPSCILRSTDGESRRVEMQLFVRDLRKVAQLMKQGISKVQA